MISPLPRTQHGVVLADIKAKPSGRPAASLDPGSGRRTEAANGSSLKIRNHKSQVSTVSGDCRNSTSEERVRV